MNDYKSITERDVAVVEWTFHLAENGDPTGHPVMWLHGSGPGVTALSNWQDSITHLAHYRNYCPDMLGFGDSSHPDPPPQGLPDWADLRAASTIALMDTLGIQKSHFVGNSMGGMVTLAIVKRYPQRVAKIVLMGSGGAPFPPGPPLANLMTFYQDPSEERLLKGLRDFVYDPDSFGDRLQKIAAARLPRSLREDVKRSHLSTFSREGDATTRPVISEDELRAINSPTLLLHGREDAMLPVAGSYWLGERIPNAQVHTFPFTGHWTQIEQPLRFRTLVDAFFKDQI